MRRLSTFLIFIALCVNACVLSGDQGKREKRVGINGEAVYMLNADEEIVMLFKEEYHNEKFEVLLRRDTLEVGDSLHSLILLPKANFRITISKPGSQVIEGDGHSTTTSYSFITGDKSTAELIEPYRDKNYVQNPEFNYQEYGLQLVPKF